MVITLDFSASEAGEINGAPPFQLTETPPFTAKVSPLLAFSSMYLTVSALSWVSVKLSSAPTFLKDASFEALHLPTARFIVEEIFQQQNL